MEHRKVVAEVMKRDPKSDLIWQCRVIGLPPPVLEHRFHPTRRWRWDLCWPERMIAVEYDGLFSAQSGHRTMGGSKRDREKDLSGIVLGWCVIRCCYDNVRSGLASQAIKAAWDEREEKAS